MLVARGAKRGWTGIGLVGLSQHIDRFESVRSLTDPDDLTLANQVATDRASFGILYERYVDRIYAFCYRRLQSREAAEDATSQTFVKLLIALQKPNRRQGSVKMSESSRSPGT